MKTSRIARMKNGFGLALLRTLIGGAWWLPVLCLLATTATTLALQSGDFTYTINSGNTTVTITDYTGSGGAVVIPSTIDGKAVTSIGPSSFLACVNLTSVTIPNSVVTIGGEAFKGCTKLASVAIGNGVTTIGSSAFDYCSSLTSVTIPDSVTTIGDISESSFGSGAFAWCTSLASVTIGNGVTTIGKSAFVRCASLASVKIGNSVTSIGVSAFEWCTSLAGICFQGNAPSLGLYVFGGDENATIYYLAGTTGWGTTFGGRPTAVFGPIIKANGATGNVVVNYPEATSVTVEMNAATDAGINKDWWVVALAGSSWYYLNNSFQWTSFDGNLSNCHPVYQGALFNLSATEVLNYVGFPVGLYAFWFAVDQMDGILNLDGPIWVNSVNVTVQ